MHHLNTKLIFNLVIEFDQVLAGRQPGIEIGGNGAVSKSCDTVTCDA